MLRLLLAVSIPIVLLSAAGPTQTPVNTALLVNRISGAYRSVETFLDQATVKRKVIA